MTKYCKNCGEELEEEDEFCSNCGKSLNTENKINKTNNANNISNDILEKINTGLATVLSGVFIGLGQLYNGQIEKGIFLFIVGIIITFIELFFYQGV